MALGNGKNDTNYSSDDKKGRIARPCRYCGKIMISPMGRWRHLKKYHDKEFVRY